MVILNSKSPSQNFKLFCIFLGLKITVLIESWLLILYPGEHKSLNKYLCYFLQDFCYYSLELTLKPYIPVNQSQIILNLFFSWYWRAATTSSLFFYLHVSFVCLKTYKVQVCSGFNNFQPRFTLWLIMWHSFLSSSCCFLQALCLFLAAWDKGPCNQITSLSFFDFWKISILQTFLIKTDSLRIQVRASLTKFSNYLLLKSETLLQIYKF